MNSILSVVLNWLCTTVQWGATFFIMLIINTLTDSNMQTLSISYFEKNFFTNGSLDQILYGFKVAGMALAIMLFFFTVFLVGFKDLLQQKDSMLDLMRRLIFTVFIVLFINNIFSLILNYADDLMNTAAQEEKTTTGYTYFGIDDSDDAVDDFSEGDTTSQSILDDIKGTLNDDPDTSLNDTEKESWLSSHSWGLNIIFDLLSGVSLNPKYAIMLLLRAVFFCVIAYNFVKLFAEYLKRYTTMFILYMLSPLFSAFFATSSTQLIFLSYFKMFGTTVLIIALTKIWMYLSTMLMQTVVSSFVNMCIMMAFINFGVKFEMWTREIGMSTANLGGALLDNIVLTAGIMGRVGKEAFGHAGNGLINAGGLTGNAKLVAAGSAMTGKSLTPDNIFRTMNESTGGVIRQDKLKSAATSNLTPTQMDLASKAMSTNGLFRNATLSNMYHSLNAAGKQELMQGLMKDTYSGFSKVLNDAGMKLSDLTYDNKGINFTATGKNGIKRNCTIGEAPAKGIGVTSIGGLDANGKQIYLNMQSGWEDLKNAKGKPFKDAHVETVTKDENGKEQISTFIPQLNGTSAIEMETGTNLSAFVQDNDTDASHYQAMMNDMGNLDVYYAPDGESFTDIGAVTYDGLNLFKGTNDYGDNMANSAMQITDDGLKVTDKKNPLPFEADFALQFAKAEQVITIDHDLGNGNTEKLSYKAMADGPFCNTGRTNIHGVERLNDGKTIKFLYTDTVRQNKDNKPSVGYVTDAYTHQRDATSRNICGNKTYGTKLMK